MNVIKRRNENQEIKIKKLTFRITLFIMDYKLNEFSVLFLCKISQIPNND